MIKYTTLVWPGVRAGAETSVYQLQHRLQLWLWPKVPAPCGFSFGSGSTTLDSCMFIYQCLCQLKMNQGSIFWSGNSIYPPPPTIKWYFSPSCNKFFFFYSYPALFALIVPSFACILTIYFPFSLFLTSFLPFLYIFPIFFFTFSYFFLKMTSANIFLTPVGPGVFPIYRSLDWI